MRHMGKIDITPTDLNPESLELESFTNKIIKATMDDIYHIIIAIDEHEDLHGHEIEFESLKEMYLYWHTTSGEYEFNSHYYGLRTVEQIIKYKPEIIKPKYNFVVEM